MTRKDYVMLANILRNVRGGMLGSIETVDTIVKNLAIELHADNPRFDPERFKSAIGIR